MANVHRTAPVAVSSLGSVEIGLDDFGMNPEDMAVGRIDDYPQIVDIGRAERLDASFRQYGYIALWRSGVVS